MNPVQFTGFHRFSFDCVAAMELTPETNQANIGRLLAQIPLGPSQFQGVDIFTGRLEDDIYIATGPGRTPVDDKLEQAGKEALGESPFSYEFEGEGLAGLFESDPANDTVVMNVDIPPKTPFSYVFKPDGSFVRINYPENPHHFITTG